MSSTNLKLSFTEKFGYGLGDMAANFVFQAMMALQLSFYTDTYGLSAAQAGSMFLIVGLGMACLNPVMGVVADRTSTRWGRFPPLALVDGCAVRRDRRARLHDSRLEPRPKLIYAWATYLLLRLVYTMNNVPYASLNGVMTEDPNERNSIATYRQMFANGAGFIVQALAIPMVFFLGRGSSARGYQLTMGSSCCTSVVFFLIAFSCRKERIQPDPKQKSSVLQDLGDLMKNEPWIILFLVTTFYFIGLMIRGSIMLPYFKYCAGNPILFSWFNGFGSDRTADRRGLLHRSDQAMGKRAALSSGAWSSPALCASRCIFFPATATVPIIALEVLRQFAFGCSGPVLWSMMGDVADFGEWKTGRRATGNRHFRSRLCFVGRTGLGGAIAGWLLSLYGFQSNAAQTEHALLGIRLIASVFSGAAFLVAAVCLIFYGINMKLNLTISHDLSERRKGFSA